MADYLNTADPYGIQRTIRRRRQPEDSGVGTEDGGGLTTPATVPNLLSPSTGIPAPPPQDGVGGRRTRTGSFLPGEDTGGGTGYNTGPTDNGPNDAITPPAYSPIAISGWEQSNWDDPNMQTPKYVIGRILSSYPATPEGLRQAMPAIQAAFPGTELLGLDKINIPGTGIIDVGANFGGENQSWWWGWGQDGSSGTSPQTGSSGLATSILSGGGGYSPSSAVAAGGGAYGDQIRAMVLRLMNQSPTDVSTNPTYTGALDAYRTEQQRAMERDRNAIAERMNAEGTLNTGGFTNRVLGAEQEAGENTATFAGQLAIRELERQRDEIMQALTIGAGLLTEEQRIALSERLGLINADLQQQSILNQNNQFNQNLGWDMATWEWLRDNDWWRY